MCVQYSEVSLKQLAVAGFSKEPPAFLATRRVRGARLAGMAYERRAQEYLLKRFEGFYLRSPWLVYLMKTDAKVRWAQPDGLIFNFSNMTITIVEIKLKHTGAAYHQVKNLYAPLIKSAFPRWQLRAIEMVKWYDGTEYFPEEFTLIDDLSLPPRNGFGVHIWKP